MQKETINEAIKDCEESIEYYEERIELERLKILAFEKELKNLK